MVSHADIALDMWDIANLLNAARKGDPVEWAAIASLYKNGLNTVKGDGSVRTRKSLVTSESVIAEFPGGADPKRNIQTGLTAICLGETVDNPTRRHLINEGIQAVTYSKELLDLTAARVRLEAGNTGDNIGAAQRGRGMGLRRRRPRARRKAQLVHRQHRSQPSAEFWHAWNSGRILASGFGQCPVSIPCRIPDRFRCGGEGCPGYLNTIFHLAALRKGTVVVNDDHPVDRKIHRARG